MASEETMDAREIEGGHTTAHLAGLGAIIALSPREQRRGEENADVR
jgi:hypothetical protein